MSCPRLFEVEAFRDGRITGAELASFECHLATCAECTKERDALDALATRVQASAPLDELHAARERRRLLTAFEGGMTTPRARRRWWFVLVPAAAAAAMASASLYWRPHPPMAHPPASVVVRSEPAAGEVAFTQTQEPTREVVDLKAGTLFIAVDHRAHPKALVIALPDGELEDIGTVFTITVRSGATSEVRVQEGSVVLHLRSSAEPIRLEAGQSWTPRAPEPPPVASSVAPARTAPPVPSLDPTAEYRAALALYDAGDYAAAAPKLAHFAAAHPDHVHGEDAAYLRVIALERSGDTAEMQRAAADYLRAYPNGFRHQDVERVMMRVSP